MASRGCNHSRADYREIFIYQLLYLAETGPEPHFMPGVYSKSHASSIALFIATKSGKALFFAKKIVLF